MARGLSAPALLISATLIIHSQAFAENKGPPKPSGRGLGSVSAGLAGKPQQSKGPVFPASNAKKQPGVRLEPAAPAANQKPVEKLEQTPATLAPQGKAKTPTEAKARLARMTANQAAGEATTAAGKASELRQLATDATRRAESADTTAKRAKREASLAESEHLGAQDDLRTARQRLGVASTRLSQAAKSARKSFFSMMTGAIVELWTGEESSELDGLAAAELEVKQKVKAVKSAESLVGRLNDEATTKGQTAKAHEETAAQTKQKAKEAALLASQHEVAAGAKQKYASEAEAAAAELESHAEAANVRYDQRFAKMDQHLLRIAKSAKGRAQYRKEADRLRASTFVESKPGEVSQDAVAMAPETKRFAIADGVTNSDFSGEFARALVREWTDNPVGKVGDFNQWLSKVQAEWQAEVDPVIAVRKTQWFNKNKTWTGHAAFVGAHLITDGGKQKLRALGLGDTVMFLVRGGTLKRSFPLEEAAEFSDVVKALPSKGTVPFKVREVIWDVKPGDEVFMATDALAHWTLEEVEAGRDPFPVLRGIQNGGEMSKFVEQARGQTLTGRAQLHVDDTSLVRFVVPAK